MSTAVDPVPARPRHLLSMSETSLTLQRPIESQQPKAKPRDTPTPRTLQPEDSVPKPSCAPTPLNSFPFVTLAIFLGGRGRMAQSVPQATHRLQVAPTPAAAPLQPNCDEKESRAVLACFKAGRNAFVSISVPPTHGALQTQTDSPMGDQRISRSDKTDEKRGISDHVPAVNDTDSSIGVFPN